MADKTIERLIREETEKRLSEMEKKDYIFPKRIGAVDVVAIVVSVAISITLIVLCMSGVIQ